MARKKVDAENAWKTYVTAGKRFASFNMTMKSRITDKSTLDSIGRELFKKAAVPAETLDEITSAPEMFQKILVRAAAERPASTPGMSILAWKSAVAGFAAVVLICVAAVVWFVRIRTPEEKAAVSNTSKPVAVPVSAISADNEAELPKLAEISYRNEPKLPLRRTKKKRDLRTPQRSKRRSVPESQVSEFYALNFAPNTEETYQDGRIIRVKLSRTSLFALGVNIPLENDAVTIKTDLLVGPDGVAQAIRLVD